MQAKLENLMTYNTMWSDAIIRSFWFCYPLLNLYDVNTDADGDAYDLQLQDPTLKKERRTKIQNGDSRGQVIVHGYLMTSI